MNNITMQKLFTIVFSLLVVTASSQDYTLYFTGSTEDTVTSPLGGVCLMGGATEDDNAMQWFLEQANGGDVLVLRASGSDGYNQYLYNDLGVNVNSVESIVFNNANASSDSYIHTRILQAEAIWFAGGDQWNYVSYWRNTAIDSLIRQVVRTRNVVLGGTSAGMAIMGEYYFSAQNGTVTSSTALDNPFDSNVTIDSARFLEVDVLRDVITDTHYDAPDRKGRHVVFLARMLTDYGSDAKGIACDEYTAVCIDNTGMAHIYGGFPTYDDNAYFIQRNCEVVDNIPETISANVPLTWDKLGLALTVYKVKGTSNGENSFDLNTWDNGYGGTWENWSVSDGQLFESVGSLPNCDTTATNLENPLYPKRLLRVVDFYGRESTPVSQPLIYIYENGSAEQKVVLK